MRRGLAKDSNRLKNIVVQASSQMTYHRWIATIATSRRIDLNIVTLYKSTMEIQLDKTRDYVCIQNDNDTSDESSGRPQSSYLETVLNRE